MIYKLKQKDYYRIKPLFKGMDYHLAVYSILAGYSPGNVYADNPENPHIAFVWDHTEGGYYLAGEPGGNVFRETLGSFIAVTLREEAEKIEHLIEFTLDYYPQNWDRYLAPMLETDLALQHKRKYFEINEAAVKQEPLPQGYSYVPVDDKLLANDALKNIEDVREWIEDVNWGSAAVFMERGLGWCIIHGEVIVSWCIADYAVGDRLEIGIHTDEDYRKQGFAHKTVRKTLQHAFARGFKRIGWHCWSSNTASAATALKAGFREVVEHPVYHRWYNDFDNWLVRAWFHYEWKEPEESVKDYDKAFGLLAANDDSCRESEKPRSPEYPWILLNAARCYAVCGKINTALEKLEQSVDCGFNYPDMLKTDPDLEALRDLPGFCSLLASLEKKK